MDDLRRENTRLRTALAWMWFAYCNKDKELPHDFEAEAVRMAQEMLGGEFGVVMPEAMKQTALDEFWRTTR